MTGQVFNLPSAELPNGAFDKWREGFGPQTALDAAQHALALEVWPDVLVTDSQPHADLLLFLVRVWPETRFLFLIEEPTASLARQLPLSQGHTIAAWSVRQEAAAQAKLRLLQRHPNRGLCVVAKEAAADPRSLRNLLQDRLGLSLHVASQPLRYEPPSELHLALASMLLAPEVQLAASASELLATCPPLGDQPADVGPAAPDRGRLLHELATLAAQASAVSSLQTRIVDLEVAKNEAVQLLAQLHHAQEQLEQATLRERELTSTANARSARLATAEALAKQLDVQNGHLERDKTRLTREVDAFRRENELLLVHLHQVQEELERSVLENRELVHRSEAGLGGPSLNLEGCQVESIRDSRPHLELVLRLHGVRLGNELALRQLNIRLVEHGGRPGIVFVYDPTSTRQYLSSWVATGREGDVEHMLIVPADTAGRALLQHLPTSDWNALVALTSRMQRELAELDVTAATFWPTVASRLTRELAELPPRLRYDQLHVEQAAQGYTISMDNVVFGVRRFRQLQLLWQTDAAAPLSLLAPPDKTGPPALDEWPRKDGHWQPLLSLPIGKGAAWTKRRRWARLGPLDRGLLLGLLDALPAAVQDACASGLISESNGSRLRSLAVQLLRDGLFAAGQRESFLRRLVRRLRARKR